MPLSWIAARPSSRKRTLHHQQQAADQSKVLQEIPEMAAALAVARCPEIGEFPERVVQHRGYRAETGENQRSELIVPACYDAHGGCQLDHDRDDDERRTAGNERRICLLQRVFPEHDLVQRAEREQHDQANARDQRHRGEIQPRHARSSVALPAIARVAPSRSAIRSATRSALAIIVSVGFTAPIDGKKLASAMYRLSSSCALQSRSSTELAGSVPKRQVPAWCAVPPIGMSLPRYRRRSIRCGHAPKGVSSASSFAGRRLAAS